MIRPSENTLSTSRMHDKNRMGKYYTAKCKEKGWDIVNQKDRTNIFNDFVDLILEDIVVNRKTIRTSLGTLSLVAEENKFNRIDYLLTEDFKNPIYVDVLEWDGYYPLIKFDRITRKLEWKIYPRHKARGIIKENFNKNYKLYIK